VEEVVPTSRTIQEPWYSSPTSDVDFLDDGYCWRKYGQKQVKGSLHLWCVSYPSALICSIETVSCSLLRFCHISLR